MKFDTILDTLFVNFDFLNSSTCYSLLEQILGLAGIDHRFGRDGIRNMSTTSVYARGALLRFSIAITFCGSATFVRSRIARCAFLALGAFLTFWTLLDNFGCRKI